MSALKEYGLEIPIIQGGMGIGISLGSLAGHVMKEGGMGTISAAHPGYAQDSFLANPLKANWAALKEEVRKARKISQGKGILAVNIMCASRHYPDYVKAALEAGFDAIVSGAGLPTSLPAYTKDASILLAPVVSSLRAFRLICTTWQKRYHRQPDFVIVEGPLAGGHLGFKKEELISETARTLEETVADILAWQKEVSLEIPVFAAGGVRTGSELIRFLEMGAAGIQIATPLIPTEECDASLAFKQRFLDRDHTQTRIIASPTGYPARALDSPFTRRASQKRIPPVHCLNCLRMCRPSECPYCITEALICAVQGDQEKGLFFSGSLHQPFTRIRSVHEVLKDYLEPFYAWMDQIQKDREAGHGWPERTKTKEEVSS